MAGRAIVSGDVGFGKTNNDTVHATIILHSRADDVVPFADSEELVRNSGLEESALFVVGNDHRLADTESLKKMLEVVERVQ